MKLNQLEYVPHSRNFPHKKWHSSAPKIGEKHCHEPISTYPLHSCQTKLPEAIISFPNEFVNLAIQVLPAPWAVKCIKLGLPVARCDIAIFHVNGLTGDGQLPSIFIIAEVECVDERRRIQVTKINEIVKNMNRTEWFEFSSIAWPNRLSWNGKIEFAYCIKVNAFSRWPSQSPLGLRLCHGVMYELRMYIVHVALP